MLYTLLAVAVVIVALLLAYRALKLLWLSSWFLGWIRGMFGLALLVLASAIGIVAYDIYSYKQILSEQPVATINFEAIEDQHFDAILVDANGKQQRFNMYGDQWQLDARIIKWKGYLATFGIKPAYRLDRLSGRYYDIQKETSAKRSAYEIVASPLKIDTWRFVNDHAKWFSIIDARYGSATYLPMKHGALYEVSLSNTGLVARPLNDIATKAIAEWK
jgi:hypothetical protein